MALRVQKYGGTSVEGPERIRAVAARVAAVRQAGDSVVVVVSAMGQTTDELIRLANEVSKRPSRRELDMLVTAGERISMALLAMALEDLGIDAISFTGSQSGILTDGAHTSARIVEVRPNRIRAELERGRVVIVAGFQGVNPETREITTLGRGGSDTTAVALAGSLGASLCEIHTDVSGVCTADPRVVPTARRIPRLSYALCSTLAHAGGQVVHGRCVDLAAVHGVELVVRSAFDDGPGTTIGEEEMEGGKVHAVSQRADCAIAIAEGNAGGRGEASHLIETIAEASPEMELVAHEDSGSGHSAIVWIGPREDADELARRFREWRGPGGEWRVNVEHGATFVTLVGTGLGAAHAARAENALERARVPLVALRVTPTGLIFRVGPGRGNDAVRALHAEFVEGEPAPRAAAP
jgi:aspartate kinase